MTKIIRAARCLDDLLEIWRFLSVERRNLSAAERLFRRFDKLFQLLAERPELGSRYRRELRAFPAESYVIFYEAIPDGIQVLRVIHGSRRFAPLLKNLGTKPETE